MIQYYHLIVCLTALDLIGKSAIESLPNRSFPWEMPGGRPMLLLKRFRNRSLPPGLLEKRWEVVKYGPLLVGCLVLLRLSYLLSKRGRKIEKTALTLVLAGGRNNLFDRFFRGYMVDYFSFIPEKLCHLVFNLGDLYTTAGMVVLLATEFVRGLWHTGMEGVKHRVIRILSSYVC